MWLPKSSAQSTRPSGGRGRRSNLGSVEYLYSSPTILSCQVYHFNISAVASEVMLSAVLQSGQALSHASEEWASTHLCA